MIPSTADTPGFITARPAWEQGVDLDQSLDTAVFQSRAGVEERQQRRQRSACAISYQTLLTGAAVAARNSASESELRRALVVPFWTEMAATTSAIVANVVSVSRTPNKDWFAAGDYVFFDSATQGEQFREIASVSGSALTLVADGGAVAFTSGTRIYPCRLCLHDGNRAEWLSPDAANALESMKFSTL